ncbi:MAG: porin [Phycisphaerales bacterium]|nr:porin [Phycisphaerales bacterium]
MSNGKGRGLLVMAMVLAGTGWVWADEEPLPFKLSGHVEGSYTYDAQGGLNKMITGRVFDFESQDPTFNQITLAIERTVDPSHDVFDLGGRMEWMYGADARKIHSTGLFDYFGGEVENQFDLTQAYVDVAIPLGNGIRLRMGKFVTPLGFEVIDPTGNWLYSHSYLFGAIAFTHTGALVTYAINEKLTLDGGISRGWDDALEDKNDAMDLLGRVTYQLTPKTSMLLAMTAGPERSGNNGIWRTTLDGMINHQVNDDLKLGGEGLWVMDGGMESAWFGIAGYAQYRPCGSRHIALNLRAEWFVDETGAIYGTSANLYEVTLGLGITPMPDDRYGKNLMIRPEIRGDYAQNDFFDGGTENFQFTAAIDAIYSF